MAYDLGIVIPVYRSKESVNMLVERLEEIFLPDIKIRICLVDDSNDEDTTRYLMEYCLKPEVTLVVLDGNFGQQAATLCGLKHVGPCRTYGTIDDDLEQPPEMLRRLYERVEQGCDLAYGIPVYEESGSERPVYRKIGSHMRDIMFSSLIKAPGGIRVSSLRVMSRHVVRDLIRSKPRGFFYLSAAVIKGGREQGRKLRIENLSYRRDARLQGKSGYRAGKLLQLYGGIFWNYGLGSRIPDNKTPGRIRPDKGSPVYRIKGIIRPEKLLLLGGSNCQLHGAQRANALGVDTVLADYTAHPPAADICGVHEWISTFDVEECIRAAKRYRVTGVMTMGTDQPVYTAARIARELRLPGCLTPEKAYSVTNKKEMKRILAQAGIPAAPYQIVDKTTKTGALSELNTPLVIKPLDSQGQRGIYKLDTPEEALRHLEQTLSYSRCRQALVEEFYDSSEVTVSGWIKDGRLYVLTVTDRLLYPDQTHIGVCTGHRFPSVHMGRYEEIADISRRTAEAFGLENGPFYLQLLIGEQGIRVNELAARIGGAFEDVLIPWISGFDILGAVIDSALGRQVQTGGLDDYRADQAGKRAAVLLLFCHPGTIREITPLEEIISLPYVLDAGYNYKAGQTIPVMENATARFGHAVIHGTAADIGERVDDFYKRMHVRSAMGDEMLRRFYP